MVCVVCAALGQLGQESSSQLFDQLFRVPCTNQLDGIITRRFNINEQPLCEGVRRVIFPKQALNLRNEWKYGRSLPGRSAEFLNFLSINYLTSTSY